MYTNTVDYFICCLRLLTVRIHRVDHLQCHVESENRRLVKPLTHLRFGDTLTRYIM